MTRLRVETALRLLEESDKSLQEIAWGCGFGSADTMDRAFPTRDRTAALAFPEETSCVVAGGVGRSAETPDKDPA
jgi:transcriptional regulator GlxA family with amidase domain